MRRRLLPLPALLLALPACSSAVASAGPDCGAVERVALVAQSVPSASWVPCLGELPAGWRTTAFDARDGRTRLRLLSDRSGGRPVDVVLQARCDVDGATPVAPRAEGVRNYLRLRSVAPTYAGSAYDVFPGGCVRYEFAFPRGPHIPLLDELAGAVRLVPRRELRLDVSEEVGVELDP